MSNVVRTDIVTQILNERERQLTKWGVQHHPDGTWKGYESVANSWKHENDMWAGSADEDVNLTWTGILLEEIYEALAETDEAKLDYELTQAAAVIVAWKEDIRSRRVK